MDKAPEAFRTITEAAEELDLPAHVLRFWEGKFGQLRPLKRAGGRRLYRPDDIALLRGIRDLIYADGLPIKAVQKLLRDQGPGPVRARGRKGLEGLAPTAPPRRGSSTVIDDLPPWENDAGSDDPHEDADEYDGDWDAAAEEEPDAPDQPPPAIAEPEPQADWQQGPADSSGADTPATAYEPIRVSASAGQAPGLVLRRALARLEDARAALVRVEASTGSGRD